MRVLTVIAISLVILASCGPKTPSPAPVGEFAVYVLLEDVAPKRLIVQDVDRLPVRRPPVITGDDVVAYDWATHEIELTGAAYRRVQHLFTLPVDVDGLPFVVCVGRQAVYAGAFWTPLSSLSFEGVTIMQPIAPEPPVIRLDLGYPGTSFFQPSDPRGDPRILAALQAAGKLKQ